MTSFKSSARSTEQLDQCIARIDGCCGGAGLVRPASPIHLARRDPTDTQVGALSAPNGSVSIVDLRGGTSERLACGDNHRCED